VKVFIGSSASNAHLHQIGQAMEEAGMLSRYMIPFGGFPLGNPVLFPRRNPTGVPRAKLMQRPGWELTRLAAAKLRMPESWVDLIWEHEEHAFDRACSTLIAAERPDVFLGVEHAALAALRTSRANGTAAGLIYPSLHHLFRKKWLDPELVRYPELLGESARGIRERDAARDARRDEEMGSADFIHANSEVTARSLVEAGYPAQRIMTVPLGAPPAIPESELSPSPPDVPAVLFVGNVALHKGAHHLIEAWRRAAASRTARLDLYGRWALPETFHPSPGESVFFHGQASPETIRLAMRRASVLVLPSVCDGFGMVVTEAMAQGLPVICSSNAGASQLVAEGKNGFVVPPANPERLAECIIWCIENPDRLHAMGRNALETARNWGWPNFRETFARELSAMLERIGNPLPPTPKKR
jgi:glycosyltransferase involved in cell wall biosynthesis